MSTVNRRVRYHTSTRMPLSHQLLWRLWVCVYIHCAQTWCARPTDRDNGDRRRDEVVSTAPDLGHWRWHEYALRKCKRHINDDERILAESVVPGADDNACPPHVMKAAIDMFLFLFKSKYRRKRMVAVDFPLMSLLLLLPLPLSLLPLVPVSATTVSAVADASPDICKDVECGNGVCVNGTCVCHDGWQGSQCQYCGGKVKWV